MRITRDPALAADATHDAFVQVWQQAGRFDPAKGEASSWLMTLARYRALDMVRRRGREVLGHEAADEPDLRRRMRLGQLMSGRRWRRACIVASTCSPPNGGNW